VHAQVAALLKAAQAHKVPVTARGGGLTTEGESVAYGGVLLDMTGMSRVLKIDREALTVRTEAGIYWHGLAEELRREGLDYLSAPLNMTSSVGGTLGVGGIDVNSARLGCSADQALALQVVTPTGEIVECSDELNPELFRRVILGYGQFGVITEATLKIRPYTPLSMHYYYYSDAAHRDRGPAAAGPQRRQRLLGHPHHHGLRGEPAGGLRFRRARGGLQGNWEMRLRGHGEFGFALCMLGHYARRPWRLGEALYLLKRKQAVFPEFRRPEFHRDGRMDDRTVVFSRAVWKHWGSRNMVIPDLATTADKFVEAVERGNAVCRKYFRHYTLYCVGIKLRADHAPHYEMSCVPPGAEGWAYGCEFEPMIEGEVYSRDHFQSFKNAIYDIGVDMGASYYRFGGMMKGYIRRVFGDALVDRHLAMKRKADPAMILNRDVIF
jgi:hypothetical protein